MRLLLAALVLLLTTPALSATISITGVSNNSGCVGNCFENDGLIGYDLGNKSSHTVGAAGVVNTNGGSATTTFGINAMSAIDGGNDRTTGINVNYTFSIQILGDPADEWNLYLDGLTSLGLHAFRGDGGASAVGNQDDGSNSISTITTTVSGVGNFNMGGASRTQDCANTCESSTQFSNSNAGGFLLSGIGSTTVNVTVDFDLRSTTNDGCSGSICSSVSGGEESAILYGSQDGMDQAVDNYGTWGRSLGPDGYDSTWRLEITELPEPSTLLALGTAFAGLIALGARRSA